MRSLSRGFVLAVLALAAAGCSLEALTGVPVPRRPWCNVKVGSAGAGTFEAGAVYQAVPCEAWHTDTIR